MNPERSERIEIPVLPLRDVVVYPHMVIPLFVGREKSIRCLEAAMDHDKKIMLVAQGKEDVVKSLFFKGQAELAETIPAFLHLTQHFQCMIVGRFDNIIASVLF